MESVPQYLSSTDRPSVEVAMTRVVKKAADRKREILDISHGLFAERGYAHTSVQAIIDAVGIAKGTFYHHFASKSAVLDALIARLIEESHALVAPLLQAELPAIDKLRQYLQRLNEWKVEQRAFMLDLSRELRADANAHMMRRMRTAAAEGHVPIVAAIIEQGVDEGVFDTRYPPQAARIFMAILTSLSETLGAAIEGAGLASRAELDAVIAAYAEAIERVLGAPRDSIVLIDPATLGQWLTAEEP